MYSTDGSSRPIGALIARVARLSRDPRAPFAPIEFPRDHGAHPGLVTEWWYFNGHLAADGRRLGYMVTFFKVFSRFAFVHLALTDLTTGARVQERQYVPVRDVATAAGRLDVTFGSHGVREDDDGRFRLWFDVKGHRLDLLLKPERQPLLFGGDGVVEMPEGTVSRYYSYTRLSTSGTVTSDGQMESVSGRSWSDHQWGNFVALRPWDWFCFQMDDGSDYSVYRYRPGSVFAGLSSASILGPDGRVQVVEGVEFIPDQWWESPASGNVFAVRWSLRIGEAGETIVVSTRVADQEMPRRAWYDTLPAYWEGTVEAQRLGPSACAGVGFGEQFPHRRTD